MITIKKKTYTLIGFFVVLILTYSCQDSGLLTSDSQSINKLDSTCQWLDTKSNYQNKEKYQKTFFEHYDELIKTNDFDHAKVLLSIYGGILLEDRVYDSLYQKTITNYLEHYPISKDSTSTLLFYFCSNQYHISHQQEQEKYWILRGLDNANLSNSANIVIRLKNLIGLYYSDMAKPDSAIQYFVEAISLAEKNKQFSQLGPIYNNIAYCYDMLGASTESAKMYQKSAEGFLLAKDTSNYFALATTYAINQLYFSKDTLKTIKLIDSAFVVFDKYKNLSGLDSSTVNNILAYKYYYTKQFDLAAHHLEKSTKYLIKTGDKTLLLYNRILESAIYFEKYKKLKNSREIETIAKELYDTQRYYDAVELYEQLYENAKIRGNYKDALQYKLIENRLNDSLTVNNQKGQLFEFERKYESQKKEQEIINQKNIITQKNTFIALLVASLLGLIASISVYYLWQRQRILKKEKEISMNFTKQLLENTEEERKRIASDLHDSISHELLSLKSQINQESKTINTKIDTIINDIRNISRNLHPVMFDKIGLQPNVEQLVERIQEQYNFWISTEIEYAGTLRSADELQVYRIIQEALTNIVKYAKAHAAKITIKDTENKVFVEIKDNGKGFSVKEALSSGKAFGLHNIIERSRIIGGEAQIVSSEAGTIITINITKKS